MRVETGFVEKLPPEEGGEETFMPKTVKCAWWEIQWAPPTRACKSSSSHSLPRG